MVAIGRGARERQRKLWVAARRSPGRRFHARYDRIWGALYDPGDDGLLEAWTRVRGNKGAVFEALGLYRLRGTIRYRGYAS